MAESFEQIKMLCWTLIIFIGIIGILNIISKRRLVTLKELREYLMKEGFEWPDK